MHTNTDNLAFDASVQSMQNYSLGQARDLHECSYYVNIIGVESSAVSFLAQFGLQLSKWMRNFFFYEVDNTFDSNGVVKLVNGVKTDSWMNSEDGLLCKRTQQIGGTDIKGAKIDVETTTLERGKWFFIERNLSHITIAFAEPKIWREIWNLVRIMYIHTNKNAIKKRRRSKRLSSHSSVVSLIAEADDTDLSLTSCRLSTTNPPTDMQVVKAMNHSQTRHRIGKVIWGPFTTLLVVGSILVCLMSGINMLYWTLFAISAMMISCTGYNSDIIEIAMSLLRLAIIIGAMDINATLFGLCWLTEALAIQMSQGHVYMFTGLYEKYMLGFLLLLYGDSVAKADIVITCLILDVTNLSSKFYSYVCDSFYESCSFPTALVLFTHILSAMLTIATLSHAFINAFKQIGDIFVWGFLLFNILKLAWFKCQDMSGTSQSLYLRTMYLHRRQQHRYYWEA